MNKFEADNDERKEDDVLDVAAEDVFGTERGGAVEPEEEDVEEEEEEEGVSLPLGVIGAETTIELKEVEGGAASVERFKEKSESNLPAPCSCSAGGSADRTLGEREFDDRDVYDDLPGVYVCV